MPMRTISRACAALMLAGMAILLGGCAEAMPTFGPGTPRNGAGEPVDAVYGTPIPGYPLTNGRGR